MAQNQYTQDAYAQQYPASPQTQQAQPTRRRQTIRVGGMDLNLDIPESPDAAGSGDFTTGTPGYAPGNNGGVAGGITTQPVSLEQGPGYNGNRNDDAYISSMISQWANLPGADPTLRSDPAYWMRRIKETGGLGPDNETYWRDMGLYNYRRSPTSGGGSGSAPGAVSGFTAEIRKKLMERLGQLEKPFDPNADPSIQASMQGARLESDRSQEALRKALSERLYAQGTVQGDQVRQGEQQSAERAAVGLGSMRAQLIQRELQSRREEAQGLLQQALSSGDAETARQIQLYMADLDARLRREGYGIQMAQYGQGQNTATVAAGS